MKRKQICILILAAALLTVGCSEKLQDSDVSSDAPAINSEVNELSIDYSKVTAITVSDTAPDLYAEPLNLQLTAAECADFRNAAASLQPKDTPSTSRPYLTLTLTDDSGQTVDVWTVDTNRTITGQNAVFWKQGNIADWLKSVADTNKIGLDAVFGRTPGSGYLQCMKDASRGKVYGSRKTQFDPERVYVLTADDFSALTAAAENAKIIPQQTDLKKYAYMMELYSENGASLYIFYLSDDGKVYTQYRYEVEKGAFTDLIEAYAKKADESAK